MYPKESLKPLMEESFDPKSFATRTIQSHAVGEMLSKLTEGITELDNELYSQVRDINQCYQHGLCFYLS